MTAKPYDPPATANPMPAIPASTVILVRDAGPAHEAGPGVEVLMLKRTGGGAFGGFWVFPGGRVDADDADELAAAVREAKEESGLELDASGFVRFSHWMPPPVEIKRFSTWFFVARAPRVHDVEIDQGEIVDHAWVRPADMFARRERGEIELAPPTFVSLTTIARHDTVDAILDEARSNEPFHYLTLLHRYDDDKGKRAFTIWPGDIAYDEPHRIDEAGARHRIELTGTPWVYQRT